MIIVVVVLVFCVDVSGVFFLECGVVLVCGVGVVFEGFLVL